MIDLPQDPTPVNYHADTREEHYWHALGTICVMAHGGNRAYLRNAYGVTEAADELVWIGRAALAHGDIEPDGTLT